jgi:hypothetical protein
MKLLLVASVIILLLVDSATAYAQKTLKQFETEALRQRQQEIDRNAAIQREKQRQERERARLQREFDEQRRLKMAAAEVAVQCDKFSSHMASTLLAEQYFLRKFSGKSVDGFYPESYSGLFSRFLGPSKNSFVDRNIEICKERLAENDRKVYTHFRRPMSWVVDRGQFSHDIGHWWSADKIVQVFGVSVNTGDPEEQAWEVKIKVEAEIDWNGRLKTVPNTPFGKTPHCRVIEASGVTRPSGWDHRACMQVRDMTFSRGGRYIGVHTGRYIYKLGGYTDGYWSIRIIPAELTGS